MIDAGARDVKSLREMGFPVWSKAISAKGTVKATFGAVNIPVVCAGVNVHPGDAVIADDDGVVVVRRKDIADVVAKGEKRHADEEGKRKKLAAGELGLDMYGMREPLAKAGLVYVDKAEPTEMTTRLRTLLGTHPVHGRAEGRLGQVGSGHASTSPTIRRPTRVSSR